MLKEIIYTTNNIESEPVFNPHPIFTPLVRVKCIQIIFDSLCHALKLLPLIEEFITAHFINSLPVRCGFRGAKPERTGHRYRKNLHLTGKLLLRCDKFGNKFINIQRKCPISRLSDRFYQTKCGFIKLYILIHFTIPFL